LAAGESLSSFDSLASSLGPALLASLAGWLAAESSAGDATGAAATETAGTIAEAGGADSETDSTGLDSSGAGEDGPVSSSFLPRRKGSRERAGVSPARDLVKDGRLPLAGAAARVVRELGLGAGVVVVVVLVLVVGLEVGPRVLVLSKNRFENDLLVVLVVTEDDDGVDRLVVLSVCLNDCE